MAAIKGKMQPYLGKNLSYFIGKPFSPHGRSNLHTNENCKNCCKYRKSVFHSRFCVEKQFCFIYLKTKTRYTKLFFFIIKINKIVIINVKITLLKVIMFFKLISISSENKHSKILNIQHINNRIIGNAFFLIYFTLIPQHYKY